MYSRTLVHLNGSSFTNFDQTSLKLIYLDSQLHSAHFDTNFGHLSPKLTFLGHLGAAIAAPRFHRRRFFSTNLNINLFYVIKFMTNYSHCAGRTTTFKFNLPWILSKKKKLNGGQPKLVQSCIFTSNLTTGHLIHSSHVASCKLLQPTFMREKKGK